MPALNNTPPADNGGWFRAMRNPETIELIRANPNAFTLAFMIAYRGQYREGFNPHCLAAGEALLGDHSSYGMSEQNYRTAKAQLEKWKFATFKPTSKGTVGKLTDTRLFSIFRLEGNDPANRQPTDSQRTGNDYQELKNVRREGKSSTADSIRLEKKLAILKGREKVLREDTGEQWYRQEHPEAVRELEQVQAQVGELENQILSQ
jgi:hypothetical protein